MSPQELLDTLPPMARSQPASLNPLASLMRIQAEEDRMCPGSEDAVSGRGLPQSCHPPVRPDAAGFWSSGLCFPRLSFL